jgi:hypothetical protein
MRRGLALFAAAAFFVVTGVAITRPPDQQAPPKDKGGVLAKAVKDLDLTDAQKLKVEQIQKTHDEKLRGLSRRMVDEQTKIDADARKALKQVLTEKQMRQVEDALAKGPPADDKTQPPAKKERPVAKAPNGNKKCGGEPHAAMVVRRAVDEAFQEIAAELSEALRDLAGCPERKQK